ncbi:hypothetical protein AB0D66_31965 [Streptomyces sp. NPDC048270]|uniref:hypothetical protein n=1 Tax=Streptomyces sp. NPDC048270 TaxID=3154615 RepID=UPI0033E214A2
MPATRTPHPPACRLRDTCPCADCRDPRTGQKLFQITDLPADLAVGAVRDGVPAADRNPGRAVRWEPDGLRSVHPRAWPAAHAPGAGDGRTEADQELWAAADPRGRLPEAAGTRTLLVRA